MASSPITSWQIDGGTMETVRDFVFLGSKITANGDCSHEINRCLLLGRKAMSNLDSNQPRHGWAAELINLYFTQNYLMFVCLLNYVWLFATPWRDCSLPGSSVHGIFQARIREWVAIPFSRGSSQPRDWTHISFISCIGRQILYQCAT